MKIVYVTGCLGFIGSHFVRKCLKLGWYVYGVDKITYAANESLLEEFNTHKNFKFEKQDIKDITQICDCDYIVNFAAESHVGNSIINSDSFIDTNVAGTKNLLDVLKNKPSNCTQRPIFLHISTDEVYGDISTGVHTEKDLLKPSNPYSAAKACSDMLIFAWARTYGLDYLIVRPTNNYGMYQHPEKLIPLIVKNLMRGKNVRLHDSGTPTRNWLHVEDTAEAVLTLINCGVKNNIYNVAGGFEQTNSETARKVIQSFHGADTDWEKYVDYSYERLGQDIRYALEDKKLRELGWSPVKVFDEEIQRIVDHYRENFRW